jgi:hypothetical protein
VAKRRRFSGNGTRRSGNVIHVSPRLMWELAWLRKLGLEDVDWDPELCCPHCRAQRAARGEPVVGVSRRPPGRGPSSRCTTTSANDRTAPLQGRLFMRARQHGAT